MLTIEQHRARPDAGGLERLAMPGLGEEQIAGPALQQVQMAVPALQQVVRVAAPRQQSRPGTGAGGRPKAGLVGFEDAGVADRRLHRDGRRRQRRMSDMRVSGGDALPFRKSIRRCRAEDVPVAPRQFEACRCEIDLGPRNGPHRRPPRSVPTDEHAPGRSRIPQGIGRDA